MKTISFYEIFWWDIDKSPSLHYIYSCKSFRLVANILDKDTFNSSLELFIIFKSVT